MPRCSRTVGCCRESQQAFPAGMLDLILEKLFYGLRNAALFKLRHRCMFAHAARSCAWWSRPSSATPLRRRA
eukprot:2984104-Rhodomonas_salina.1